MIYNVRPSILWGGGTIASFIGTTTHTHKTIFSPTETELGSKIQQDTAVFPKSPGMSEYK